MKDWFYIDNIYETDSPALVIFPERVKKNIALAIAITGDANRLRPHVKTNKIAEVCRLMMDAGITKFKCATIAEAEMLAMLQAPDVLLACQPAGPKINRVFSLILTYPHTRFSCLVDNLQSAESIDAISKKNNIVLSVYIDLNTGMNRTGIAPQNALSLLTSLQTLKGLSVKGLHAYDGHIGDRVFTIRKQKSDTAFEVVESLREQALHVLNYRLEIIAGGTPTFPVHAARKDVECSPGTFVFWDWGYAHKLPDEPFEFAALVITRVISVLDSGTVCVDLGHKSIAAENPLPRVHFLNAPEAVAVSQSEEHLVLKMPAGKPFKTGDVLYGVPVHICPTVALYDTVSVVTNHKISESWKVVARSRAITI